MRIEKVSVVIPVYNEEAAIASDLETILRTMEGSRWDYEVIVVDDACTDDTADIVGQFENVKLLDHPSRKGAGFSRNTGIKASTGDVIVVTDGDGTYPIKDTPRLLELMEDEELDMVVGARVNEAGTFKPLRRAAKWFIRWLAQFMSGYTIPDLNSGMRAIKKDVFMEFMDLLPWGHSWVSTITLALLSSGYYVGYVDIDYFPRKGTSTFRPIRDTYNYLTIVIRAITWFNPLKIFMPLAVLLGLGGLGKFIYDNLEHPPHLTETALMLFLAAIQIAILALLADLIIKRRR